MKEFVTNAGDKLMVHSRQDCRGPVCPIHNPTPHHMRAWKMIWRGDRQIFERLCEHGIGHPDPDDQEAKLFIQGFMDGVHGCDGCCARPREGDWVNARSFWSNQLYVGVLKREVRESSPQFRYYVLDQRGNKFRVDFASAISIAKPEYTMVDFDPELG